MQEVREKKLDLQLVVCLAKKLRERESERS